MAIIEFYKNDKTKVNFLIYNQTLIFIPDRCKGRKS